MNAKIRQKSDKGKATRCKGCVNSFLENQQLRDRCKFLELLLEEARALAEQAMRGEQFYMEQSIKLMTAKNNDND